MRDDPYVRLFIHTFGAHPNPLTNRQTGSATELVTLDWRPYLAKHMFKKHHEKDGLSISKALFLSESLDGKASILMVPWSSVIKTWHIIPAPGSVVP